MRQRCSELYRKTHHICTISSCNCLSICSSGVRLSSYYRSIYYIHYTLYTIHSLMASLNEEHFDMKGKLHIGSFWRIMSGGVVLLFVMSLKGMVELVVWLQNYYIIEYPQQGLFNFNLRLYQGRNKKKNFAIPYQILPSPNNQQTNTRIVADGWFDDTTVRSSTALAKYSEESVELDDWVLLRLEVEGYPQLDCEDIFLQIDFRFNHNNLKEPDSAGQLVQTLTFRLNDIENGLLSYCQAQFETPYYSRLSFSVLGWLAGFKFGRFEPEGEVSVLERKRAKAHSVNQLAAVCREQYPQQQVQRLFYTNYVKRLRISQYLLAERVNAVRKRPQELAIRVDREFQESLEGGSVREKEFKHYLDAYFPKQLKVASVMAQLNTIRQQNFDFLQRALKEWQDGELDMDKAKKQFQQFQKELFGERVFKSVLNGSEEIAVKKQLSSKQNRKIAKQIRGKDVSLNSYAVEDLRLQRDRNRQEIVFYQLSFPFKSKEEQMARMEMRPQELAVAETGRKFQYSQKHMLVVLCHGFQGSSYDMLLIKRWILQQLPDAYYLVSRANEQATEGDIRAMGKRLADEVKNYIANYMEEYEGENVIINMVGHSMGGIIARAALPHLQQYRSQFGFFCSLSSPHLGYLNGVSGLVKVGLWAIRKWKKVESLEQLSMEERGDPRKTLLYELSQAGHLRHFRKIILLSSFEDSYVSWHSARISGHRSKNSLTKVQEEMQANILGRNVFGATIHRLDVNFNVKTNDLDSFIGRTAHINLIIRENLFKMLGITIPSLFDLLEFGREGQFM